MADGSRAFNFPMPQRSRLRPGEIVVDLFAGGGGASEGLKQALGIDPALAYNHDELAIGMHAANHPLTQHHREDIWHADPRVDVAGRPIGWFHASPDCTPFSQAKGGQPRSRKTRALSWVVLKWVGQLLRADRLNGTNTAPRIISMENVWQILTWGPLVAKRCKTTGRVIKMDGTVAARGERVPVENQQLVPDKRHSGRTWRQFVAALRALGYAVDWRKLVASDYGAGTSRERLFLLGRRDGEAIVWPEASHGSAPDQTPRVTAADCLDFSIPCPSIFTRARPLADATMRRIAKGVMRHVINSADPFIVPVTHQGGDRVHDVRDPMRTITAANRGELMLAAPELAPFLTEHANASRQRTMAADEPLPTVCAGVKGGHFSVVTPILAGVGGRAGQSEPRSCGEPLYTMTTEADTALVAPHLVKFRGDSIGTPATEPVPTITSGASAARPAGAAHALGVAAASLVTLRRNMVGADARTPLTTVAAQAEHHALATAFLEQANGGFYQGAGNDARDPVSTITASGSQQRLVAAHLTAMAQNVVGNDLRAPLPTILAGATRFAEVECTLSPEQEAGALRVAAFLVKYYGSGIAVDLHDPVDTITTKDRLALVTVHIQGVPHVIVDIGLRMLKPHELYRAQGFPANYIIDRTANGTPLSTSAAVRMVGNSVSPPPLRALAEANLDRVPTDMAVAA
ncbi:TPA: DNA cytosine methyltransferase [Stenotrophomonas maltophilia]|uniref:DNA cytosine methyltransferase n=1 Tax=Stenotrophomonas sp. SMYL28 TaxID=3076049 RepID=UPI002A94774F|nr:DNA cytosine methyltransferase [Stenotrophomonas sp. SMYL28]HEL3246727.1 DNA cytosine methyltransferase [Stenotrophomonas maltophilia]HEL4248020.1 DNA cytosine methyltransferase [Stenotrophomonas maltophilia]HEL4251626.1 DNA cytosine methyltransferase [Stenotrophomonas maltophilia]HEL7615145.1 DNA cytosine methyltransferase [Stenotrophomonas maltophilia]HEL7762203.1 DNA cytosine methyltransferase [Stenotrophomonas maltophilia]